MKNLSLFIYASILLLISSSFNNPQEGEKVNWVSFEEAIELNKENPKKIFVDVYTDWCGWCKTMDKNTFNHPQIAEYLNDNYYSVKLNAEQQADIEFNGTTFKFVPQGRRGYHELAAALLNGKMSYPTVVFMDEEMRLLTPIPGYRKPEEFHIFLKFFGEDHYKSISWEDYQKTYESPF